MKRLNEYPGGWLVGSFSPTLVKSDEMEIGLKTFKQYAYEGFFYRKRDAEKIVVLDGCLLVNGKEYKKGDIIEIEPQEIKINIKENVNCTMAIATLLILYGKII